MCLKRVGYLFLYLREAKNIFLFMPDVKILFVLLCFEKKIKKNPSVFCVKAFFDASRHIVKQDLAD